MLSDGPILVLMITDSPLLRQGVGERLARQPDFRVVAGTAEEARARILRSHPDVIVLDLDLARIDALTLLRRYRALYPVPILACGSAGRNAPRALRALEIGALDVLAKPGAGGAGAALLAHQLAERIRAAANLARPTPRPADAHGAGAFARLGIDPGRYVVVIGASTGGPEAIRALLAAAPRDFPPVAIVQHMPAAFTPSFAERLSQHATVRVGVAGHGDRMRPGHAYLARGDAHMIVQRSPRGPVLRYTSGDPVNRHCPSADVLFDSAADALGARAVGVLLTGMGADGARGLLHLRKAGAVTVAQDRASCAVYGMPKAAADLHAAEHIIPPERVVEQIGLALVQNARGAGRPAHT